MGYAIAVGAVAGALLAVLAVLVAKLWRGGGDD